MVPPALRPPLKLARADKPTGYWLLMWPCWWSTALAAQGWPDMRLLALFAVGAVAMRAAGCVINDMIDRDIDARVARTRTRPLASGEVSLDDAAFLLCLLLLVGLFVLVQLNAAAVLTAAASTVLVVAYPFMKRITYWPQLFLGFTFNWGVLVGWVAVNGDMATAPLLLYAGCVAWTVGYDTIYAHQDKADDIEAGVKSTALAFGSRTRPLLALFYGLFLTAAAAAALAANLAWPFHAVLGLCAVHLAWQVATVDLDAPASCQSRFRSNSWIGVMLFAGIVAGRLAG